MSNLPRSAAGPGAATGARSADGWRLIGRRALWVVHSIMGDNAYANYVGHLRREHPDAPVPSEAEFWKAKHADAEANPKTRCC